MKKVLSMLLLLAMIVALFTACTPTETASSQAPSEAAPVSQAADSEPESEAEAKTYKIFLITMDQMDQYWTNIDKGCKEAVAELQGQGINVEYQWTAPDKKDDAQQIEKINNAVAGGADAILLAANGPDAVDSALADAEAKGVKILYVDAPANRPAYQTFATDNEAAGTTAGEELIKALEAKGVTEGKIGIVSVNSSTASTVKRENGFKKAFEGKDGFEILETVYAEGDPAQSQTAATNFVNQDVVGLFGANEGSAVGVGNAIKENADKGVLGVGFDNSDSIKGLITDGNLICTMVQNPDVMGKKGIVAAVNAIDGKPIDGEEVVDTGVSVVNKDNV